MPTVCRPGQKFEPCGMPVELCRGPRPCTRNSLRPADASNSWVPPLMSTFLAFAGVTSRRDRDGALFVPPFPDQLPEPKGFARVKLESLRSRFDDCISLPESRNSLFSGGHIRIADCVTALKHRVCQRPL